MLVYEKNRKRDIVLDFASSEERNSVLRALGLPNTEGLRATINYDQLAQSNQSKCAMMKLVEEDNRKFLMEKNAFSLGFFKFMKDVATLAPFPADFVSVR